MVAFTATSYPVLVNSYLLGDSGILITVGAAAGAVLVGRMMPRGARRAPMRPRLWLNRLRRPQLPFPGRSSHASSGPQSPVGASSLETAATGARTVAPHAGPVHGPDRADLRG